MLPLLKKSIQENGCEKMQGRGHEENVKHSSKTGPGSTLEKGCERMQGRGHDENVKHSSNTGPAPGFQFRSRNVGGGYLLIRTRDIICILKIYTKEPGSTRSEARGPGGFSQDGSCSRDGSSEDPPSK